MVIKVSKKTFVGWVDIHEEFPNTSFPEGYPQEALPKGYFKVVDPGYPEAREGFFIERLDTPKLIDGVWSIAYEYKEIPYIEPTEIPYSISMSKFKVYLLKAGILNDVTETINKLSEEASIHWEYDVEVASTDVLFDEALAIFSLSTKVICERIMNAAS